MNELIVLMRGVLSLAASLLCSYAPVFANTNVIELDCEVDEGVFHVKTEESEDTIDDSDRVFSIETDKKDFTFDMIHDGRNEDLV